MTGIPSKLPRSGTSIFSVMSKMAADHGAINLSQGFPGFDVSATLVAQVHEAMAQGYNQYAPMEGLPALREAIASMTFDRYNFRPSPTEEITITTGATEGLFTTIMALINRGDEVIVFDPGYDSYGPAIRLAGGTPIHLALKMPGFYIDWDEVRSILPGKVKVIIINTPHNPTGSILHEKDLQELALLADQHDLFVLSDEVYEHIIFDGHSHQSVLKHEALRSRSVAVSSFGKTFHATGWKVGYVVAPRVLSEEIRKVHQFVTFSVSSAVQHALAKFLTNRDHYEHLSSFYEQKRDHFLEAIQGSRFTPIASSGTYFQLLSYDSIDTRHDVDMAAYLTQQHGVASIPISVFYQDGTDHRLLRFCFAKHEDTLSEAAEKLCKI